MGEAQVDQQVTQDPDQLVQQLWLLTVSALTKELEDKPSASMIAAAVSLLKSNKAVIGGRIKDPEADHRFAELVKTLPKFEND